MRRRWLTFTLRGLLILTTLVCIWLGFQVDRVRRQHAFLKVLAGHDMPRERAVIYDYQMEFAVGNSATPVPSPIHPADRLPGWLKRMIDPEFLARPAAFGPVIWDGRQIPDDLIAAACLLPRLRMLFLDPRMTDDQVERLLKAHPSAEIRDHRGKG